MNDAPSGRLKVWTPLLFSLVMIFGMILGFNLRDSLRNKRDFSAAIERNDRLEQIIDIINDKYVDSVNTSTLYTDAVEGILNHLDPHTVYIPSEELQTVNEDLGGSFFGIGVEFSIIRDTIQVTSVIAAGPAEKAGLQVGDQIIRVEDSTVAGKKITSERIIKLLRGADQSKVGVSLLSPFTRKMRVATIQRGSIPLYSVDAKLMLDSVTGFIRINRFSATTYDEFIEALTALKKQGCKSLILDLRQNPGGYLDAATMIADEFLSDEKLLVYTDGRRSPRVDYKAGKEGMFEQGKLAVLIDESSASASEILAGAIQDWDRGIIVGRRSFGKGLVQEQFELEDGSALRLTIAKYYTPSGRSIQRSYAKGKEAYAEDFSRRLESGELTGTDTVRVTDTTKYYTSTKRPVFGGGGITPDINVPYDTARMNRDLLQALFSEDTRNLIWDYFIRHREQLKKYRDVAAFDTQFDVRDLSSYILANAPGELQLKLRSSLMLPVSAAYSSNQLKAQLARYLYRNNGYYAVLAKGDNTIRKALQELYGKSYLAIIKR